MLSELKKFYEKLQAERTAVLEKDVDSIVAEKIARQTEVIRAEVLSEINAESTVLAIKIDAISDAIKLVEDTFKAEAETTAEETPIFSPETNPTQTI